VQGAVSDKSWFYGFTDTGQSGLIPASHIHILGELDCQQTGIMELLEQRKEVTVDVIKVRSIGTLFKLVIVDFGVGRSRKNKAKYAENFLSFVFQVSTISEKRTSHVFFQSSLH